MNGRKTKRRMVKGQFMTFAGTVLLCYKSQLFKKYCPAARTMPCARQLEGKYLPDV